MNLLRGMGVFAFLMLGLACGSGATDQAASSGFESQTQAAHIVCSREDPCPKGTICLSGIRCATLCNKDSDCPTGQTCSGAVNGKHFCK
jgi:hypothetical protein